MTKEELREERTSRGMTQEQFGQFLADLLGRARAYSKSEVSVYETGQRPVPARIALALLEDRMKGDS